MDSEAGQCMTSCSEAFLTLQACAVLIVGVGGSMPAHGVALLGSSGLVMASSTLCRFTTASCAMGRMNLIS